MFGRDSSRDAITARRRWGPRLGEVRGLQWQDLDLDNAHLAIRRQADGRAPKTPKSRRSIALDAETVSALRAHRKSQREERMAIGLGRAEATDNVFTREDGRQLTQKHVYAPFHRLAAEAQVPRIRVHDLRHTYATLALGAGVHAKIVSETLGHANISITLDVYSHALPNIQEEAAERVARLFE